MSNDSESGPLPAHLPEGDVLPEVEGTPAVRSGAVVARAGRYYRNVRYLLALLGVGMALWFLYDGYVTYPKENAENERKSPGSKPPHSDKDLWLQRGLGFLMFPIAGGALAFWLHRSRGELRLDGDVVAIPGHPPFKLGDVTKVDKKLWHRKGIAVITYVTDDGREGTFKLDDFLYERPPTDAIYDAIIADMKAREFGVQGV